MKVTSLKERLASITAADTAKQARELRTRTASAWTLARTLLPSAPTDVQYKLASSLLANTTQALVAALRQTAVNAHYTRTAEKFEKAFKTDLNELLEDEKFLAKMQGDVKKELSGEAKNAGSKKAAEGKDECKCDGKGCEACGNLKTAAPEDEDLPPVEDNTNTEVPSDLPEETPEHEDGSPETDLPEETSEETPEDEMPVTDEASEIPDPIKENLEDKIDTLQADVEALEETIEGEEDLDFSKIFDEDTMSDKTDSLANEDENADEENTEDFDLNSVGMEADGSAAYFTDSNDMAEQIDGDNKVTSMTDFFQTASNHNAAALDGLLGKDAVVERGSLTKSLIGKDSNLDAVEDHEDAILFEVLTSIKPEPYDPGAKRHAEPELKEAPKVAKKASVTPKQVTRSASGKPMRTLGNVRKATAQPENDLSRLLFGDEEI